MIRLRFNALSWLLVVTTVNAVLIAAAILMIPPRLAELASFATTRPLGIFPENLREVTKLISRTEPGEELCISTDVLGYGLFSSYEEYRSYSRAIESQMLKSGSRVRMTSYGGPALEKSLTAQFRTAYLAGPEGEADMTEFEAAVLKSQFHLLPEVIEAIASQSIDTPSFMIRDPEQKPQWDDPDDRSNYLNNLISTLMGFESFLAKRQRALTRDGSDFGLRLANGDMLPVFCWIRGDTEAIFAIPVLGMERSYEASFYTQDKQIIKCLKDAFLCRYETAQVPSSNGKADGQ